MYFFPIVFMSPEYDAAIDLRTRVLRIPLNLEFEVQQLESEFNENHFGVFNEDHKLLACLSFKKAGTHCLQMRQVAVEPDFQNQGVGQFLVKQAESWAMSNGFNEIQMHARDTAVPFYEKLDYHVFGDAFIEVNIRHRNMSKKLI